MTASIRSDASGFAAIAVNGGDALKVNGVGALALGSDGYGTSGQLLRSAGSGDNPSWDEAINSSTVTPSGAAFSITGFPDWATRITLSLCAITTTGTSLPILRLETGGSPVSTGYTGTLASTSSTTTSYTDYTTCLGMASTWSAAAILSGTITLQKGDNNLWSITFCGVTTGSLRTSCSFVTLAGALSGVRLTTAGGTETYDGGSIITTWE